MVRIRHCRCFFREPNDDTSNTQAVNIPRGDRIDASLDAMVAVEDVRYSTLTETRSDEDAGGFGFSPEIQESRTVILY